MSPNDPLKNGLLNKHACTHACDESPNSAASTNRSRPGWMSDHLTIVKAVGKTLGYDILACGQFVSLRVRSIDL